jgi:AbrB family looped-hinge helix DNA binding protein
MAIATISTKGQVTLPASLRKRLGMKPHDRVSIESTEEGILIKPVPSLFDFEGFAGKALPREEELRRAMKGVADHQLGRRK